MEVHDWVAPKDRARSSETPCIKAPPLTEFVHTCARLPCPLCVEPANAPDENVRGDSAATLLAHELIDRGPALIKGPQHVKDCLGRGRQASHASPQSSGAE